jgi:hypothetical protein
MENEGWVAIDWRRYGALGWLRRKQWWYFEGLDPERRQYFVFLALQGLPSSYVSLKWIDYANDRRYTEEHLGSFQAGPGGRVDVRAEGKWGSLRFEGSAEQGWSIAVQTSRLQATFRQRPKAPVYRVWLLTQHIDYTIQQFIFNECAGQATLDGEAIQFSGYGYAEHNWGVQPRHSTAHWLHFWSPQMAGVVLSCFYDAGVPHHYTCLWRRDQMHSLHSPATFSFNPAEPLAPWQARSPDLTLSIQPIAGHHTRLRIPPGLAYVDVDYYEQLLQLQGTAWLHGELVEIDGVGKLDFNWNRW